MGGYPLFPQLVPWRGDDDDGSGAATTTPAGSGSPRSPLHEDAELRRTATALAHLHDEVGAPFVHVLCCHRFLR